MANEISSNEGKKATLKSRNEFLFLYDIKNGNPNGDPDENRPRIDDVTKHCYVTDVRLKRFIRDYLIQTEGEDFILVTKLGTRTVNLTDRVKDSLEQNKLEGKELLNSMLDRFVDLRMFGSPLAFKDAPADWGETSKVTGPIQINFGETLHKVEEVTFHGTSIFSSKGEAEDKEWEPLQHIMRFLMGSSHFMASQMRMLQLQPGLTMRIS